MTKDDSTTDVTCNVHPAGIVADVTADVHAGAPQCHLIRALSTDRQEETLRASVCNSY